MLDWRLLFWVVLLCIYCQTMVFFSNLPQKPPFLTPFCCLCTFFNISTAVDGNFALYLQLPPRWIKKIHHNLNFHRGGCKIRTLIPIFDVVNRKNAVYFQFPPQWILKILFVLNFHLGGWKNHALFWIFDVINWIFTQKLQFSSRWIGKAQKTLNFHRGVLSVYGAKFVNTAVDFVIQVRIL